MKSKKSILTIAISISAIVAVLLLFFLSSSTQRPSTSIPPAIITPTGTILENEPLRILNVLPPETTEQKYPPIQQVAFIFNYPVLPDSFVYDVQPFTETTARQGSDSNTIVVSVNDIWTDGTTVIRVLPQTKAFNDKGLPLGYTYRLYAGFPPVILDSHDY